MALGDITIFNQSSAGGGSGSQTMYVQASALVPYINAGEPVLIVAGTSSVIPGTTNMLTLTSPFVPLSTTGTAFAGIAETNSTSTASAVGVVSFVPANANSVYLINAKVSASVNTQAKYDALVGLRVLIDLTSGSYTCLLADSALNGFIIRPLDVVKYPGKVAISPRTGIFASM